MAPGEAIEAPGGPSLSMCSAGCAGRPFGLKFEGMQKNRPCQPQGGPTRTPLTGASVPRLAAFSLIT